MSCERRNIFVKVLLIAALLSAAVLSVMLATGENARISRDSVSAPVHIEGEYRADGGEWRMLDAASEFGGPRQLEIRGHFDRDIEKNFLLMFRIQHLRVNIKLNGEEFFSFGGAETLHRLSASAGDVWQWVASPGIKSTDLVEIKLGDVYGNENMPVMERFLRNMCFGHTDKLYARLAKDGGAASLVAMFVVLIGILELFSGTLLFFLKQKRISKVFYCGAFSASLGVWCVIQNAIVYLTPFPTLTAYVEMLSMYLTSAFYVLYTAEYVSGQRRKILSDCASALFLVLAAQSLWQIFGGAEVYASLNVGTVIALLGMLLGMACLAVEYVVSGEKSVRLLALSTVPIALGAAADAVIYWLMPWSHAHWLQKSFYIFVFAQWAIMVWQYKRNFEIVMDYQRELTLQKVLTADALASILIDLTTGETLRANFRYKQPEEISEKLVFAEFAAIAESHVAEDEKVKEFFRQLTPEGVIESFRRGQGYTGVEYECVVSDGSRRWIRDEQRVLSDPDSGHLMLFVRLIDIDDEVREREKLETAVQTDLMTGLFNHDATFDHITNFLRAQGRRGRHALIMVDIDNFKTVNDTLGHQNGDEVLKKAAATLKKCFRSSDIVGRVGGDEFMALLKNAPSCDFIREKATEVVNQIQFPCSSGDKTVSVTASVGVSVCDSGDREFEQLYKEADAALYVAKKAGKGCYNIDRIVEDSSDAERRRAVKNGNMDWGT